MKWFLILLAIGLTASEKLDRTYLPPPGAQYAGGNPGDIHPPLQLPNNLPDFSQPLRPALNGPGYKGTQTPITTTSYAFTQTTTFPPIETYETTAIPINPITGLPVQILNQPGYDQYNQNQGQNQGPDAPNYGSNVQPGFISQGSRFDGQPINIGSNNNGEPKNQLVNQYLNQRSESGIPASASQQPGFSQNQVSYPGGQVDNEISHQYPSQEVIVPGGDIQIPGSGSQGINQVDMKYSGGPIIPGQQQFIPSTDSTLGITVKPQGTLPGQISQGTYSNQPIVVEDAMQPSYDQNYPNQGQIVSGPTTHPQLLSDDQNITLESHLRPEHDHNDVSSATVYSAVGPITRPERPQAAADRNAVILKSENVLKPNSYSYSYDTSNGIHADETGIVDDGTKAQGSYSYVGDDGKVYSVYYTADENGFRPRGDHLPTPPPIPEAIQKVIEQAARDKEAGIVDDGSYDEDKYGYKKYQDHPYRQETNQAYNSQHQNNKVRPISGITEEEYDGGIPRDQLNNGVASGNNKNQIIEKYSSLRPSNEIANKNEFPGENKDISEDNYGNSSFDEMNNDQGNTPHLVNYNSPASISDVYELAVSEKNKNAEQDSFEPKYLGSTRRRPITNSEQKNVMQSKTINPNLSNTNIEDINPDIEDGFDAEYDNNIRPNEQPSSGQASALPSGRPSLPNISSRRPNLNQRPATLTNNYVKEPQTSQGFIQGDVNNFDKQTNVPSVTGYSQNNINQQPPNQGAIQHVDENGYYYNPPKPQFPTRFKEVTSAAKPMKQKFDTSTTVRPFQTPEVHNQPSSNRRKYNRPSTTLRPFMTSRVTTSKYNPDYDDNEDYNTDLDIDDARVSTRRPVDIGTRRPQDAPYGVTQKETITPSNTFDYPTPVTLGYTPSSTTSIPSQNSRFGTTEISPMKPQQSHLPSTSAPISTQSPYSKTPDYRYQTTRPISITRPTYSPNAVQPNYGTRLKSGQTGSIPQNYQTSTYKPAYPTAGPTTPSNQPGSEILIPSGTPGTYQPSQTNFNQNGYQYGPVQSASTTASPRIPERPDSASIIPGTSTPSYYKTTYENEPINYPGTTLSPSTSRRPGVFILSGREMTPTSASIPSYQYGTTTPGIPSILGNFNAPSNSDFSGSISSQASPSGYQYGPPSQVYSTIAPPSTIGTTPGFFASSTPPSLASQVSTTQEPLRSSTQETYKPNLIVDGFGRPINSEQQPVFSRTGEVNQGPYAGPTSGREDVRQPGGLTAGPISLPSSSTQKDNSSPTYGVEQNPPSLRGYYEQPEIVGEDFSGPKQPQRFDPKTGYHYK